MGGSRGTGAFHLISNRQIQTNDTVLEEANPLGRHRDSYSGSERGEKEGARPLGVFAVEAVLVDPDRDVEDLTPVALF